MNATRPLETLLAPIDLGRSAVLRLVGPRVAGWIRDRDARVAAIGVFAVAVAFVLTVCAPLPMLALTPILFGVPHLVADVRYLVARPGLHRVKVLWLAAVPLVAVAFAGGSRAGFLVVPIAVVAARASLRRSAMVLAIWSVAYGATWRAPWLVDLLFVHAHNFIAVALWWAWRPKRARSQRWVLVAFVAASIAIAAGAAEPILARTHGFTSALPIDLGNLAFALAPTSGPTIALRLVLLYAFAQSMHYAVWLRLVPEDDRPRRAPRSFVASVRALRQDLGAPLLLLAFVASLALAVWALVDLVAARDGYLRAAQFHGHLELAAAAYLWLRRPRARVAARALAG
jgi:hypothetical protein